MNAVSQTVQGGPDSPPQEHGDCFRACLCSILELPIEAFESPSPNLPYDEWTRRWQEQLVARGLWMVGIEVNPDDDPWWVSPGFWIASVPSLNLGTDEGGEPIRHAVVMNGPYLAHDPARNRRYKRVLLTDVLAVRWLVPLDPASHTEEEGT